MGGFIGAFFEAGASLIGGVSKGIGGLLGGGSGGGASGLGAIFGGDIFGLGSQIFGGSAGGGGFFSSPIAGNIIGAVGQELLRPSAGDLAKQAAAAEEGRLKARQRIIRQNYGLPAEHPTPYVSRYRPERTVEKYVA